MTFFYKFYNQQNTATLKFLLYGIVMNVLSDFLQNINNSKFTTDQQTKHITYNKHADYNCARPLVYIKFINIDYELSKVILLVLYICKCYICIKLILYKVLQQINTNLFFNSQNLTKYLHEVFSYCHYYQDYFYHIIIKLHFKCHSFYNVLYTISYSYNIKRYFSNVFM